MRLVKKLCVILMFVFNASAHAEHSDDLKSTDKGVRIWSQYKTPEILVRKKANQEINEALIKLKNTSAHKKLYADNKTIEVFGSDKYFGAISYIIIGKPFRNPYDRREVEPPSDTAIESVGKWFRFLQQNEHLLNVKLPATFSDADILEIKNENRLEYIINGSIVTVLLDNSMLLELNSKIIFRSRSYSEAFDGTWDIYLFEPSHEILESQLKEKIIAKSKISTTDIHKYFLNKKLDINKYTLRRSNEMLAHPWFCGDLVKLSVQDCDKKRAEVIANTKDTIERNKPIFLNADDIVITLIIRSDSANVNGNDFTNMYYNYIVNLSDRIIIEIDSYTGLTKFVDYCSTNGNFSGVGRYSSEEKKVLFDEIKTSCD